MPDIDLLPSRIRPMDNELIASIVAVLIAAAGVAQEGQPKLLQIT